MFRLKLSKLGQLWTKTSRSLSTGTPKQDDAAKKATNANVTIQDFLKADIRVAKIVSCDMVPGADKLLKLTLDVGSGVLKTVFSGIKQHYTPEKLIGKQTLWLANLQPRTFKFGTRFLLLFSS